MKITVTATIAGEKHESAHSVPTPMREGATPGAVKVVDPFAAVNVLNQAWSSTLNMALQSGKPIDAISMKVKY